MKVKKYITGVIAIVAVTVISSGFIAYNNDGTEAPTKCGEPVAKVRPVNQVINFAISHGHCVLPFQGKMDQLEVKFPQKPLEIVNGSIFPQIMEADVMKNLALSFTVNANSLNAEVGVTYTERVQSEAIFNGVNNEKISFTSREVYYLGENWYTVHGLLSIKGVSKEVYLRATPVYLKGTNIINNIIIEGDINLFDFGIDYDNNPGHASSKTNKTMYLNFNYQLC